MKDDKTKEKKGTPVRDSGFREWSSVVLTSLDVKILRFILRKDPVLRKRYVEHVFFPEPKLPDEREPESPESLGIEADLRGVDLDGRIGFLEDLLTGMIGWYEDRYRSVIEAGGMECP